MTRALQICAVPGCPEFAPCPEHGTRAATDSSPAARGYDRKWRVYSEAFRRQYPLCRLCLEQGRQTPSEVVDHIEAVSSRDDPAFWDDGNHQALCRPCHTRKTKTEGRTRLLPHDRPPRPVTPAAPRPERPPRGRGWIVA